MSEPALHALVLAGGDSTRIRTGGPKALLDLCGRPLLDWVLSAAEEATSGDRVLVVGPKHQTEIEAWLQSSKHAAWRIALQAEPLGTGDAVRCGLTGLPSEGRVLILCGDTPLLHPETLAALADTEGGALLTTEVSDPTGYGRIVRDEDHALTAIVEQADCDEATSVIQEINAGVYLLPIDLLAKALLDLKAENAQGEFYLPDAVLATMDVAGGVTLQLQDGENEILGVNTLLDHAQARSVLSERILMQHLSEGVIIDDPASTFIEDGVEIAPGARLLPFTVIRSGCKIGSGCTVGPFSHLRTGTVLEEGAEVGNFVETKNAHLGAGVKAKHLSYLGDTTIGAQSNVGCGTITANWDGRNKHKTEIGAGVSLGSGSILIAPVRIAAGAKTGAGAVVPANHDVAEKQVVVGVPARPLSPSS